MLKDYIPERWGKTRNIFTSSPNVKSGYQRFIEFQQGCTPQFDTNTI